MKVPGIPYIQGRNYATNPAGRHHGIAVHCTASTATARQEADYATRRTDGIGSHFYVDGVEAIQSIDTIYKVNHAGSANGNNNAICLEQTGRNDWTREHWLSAINWGQMSYALAAVIKAELGGFQVRRASIAEMKANPKVAAFYSHDDMRQAWGGTTHTDPGPNYPWDRLFDSVNAALGGDMALTQEDVDKVAQRVWSWDTGSEPGVQPAWQMLERTEFAAGQANAKLDNPAPVEVDAAAVAAALVADPAFVAALEAAAEKSVRKVFGDAAG